MNDNVKTGVYLNIPNADYHSGPGISKSGLDIIARSPAHFKDAADLRAEGVERVETKAFRVGSAEHGVLLDDAEFQREFCLPFDPAAYPDAIDGAEGLKQLIAQVNETRLDKLSTTGSKDDLAQRVFENDPGVGSIDELSEFGAKDLKAMIAKLNEARPGKLSSSGTVAQLEQRLRDEGVEFTTTAFLRGEYARDNEGKTELTPAEWRDVRGMRDKALENPILANLLTDPRGVAEASVYWIDGETKQLCRCRPDLWVGDVILDIKTTDDAREEKFEKSIHNFRYHVQEAYYMDGIKAAIEQGAELPPGCKMPTTFVFGVIEKKRPYLNNVLKIRAESVEIGRRDYRRDLRTYADCMQSGKWPGYGDGVKSVGLPEWALIREAQK